MRIVLFGNSTWCLSNFRQNLIRDLVQRGFEVHAIAPLDPTFENDHYISILRGLGATFHELPMRPRNLNPFAEAGVVTSLFSLLRNIKPDVVLSYTIKCNLYAGLCRKFLNFRQIANVPGLGEVFERKSLLQQMVCSLYRVSFSNIGAVFFQNRDDLNYCVEKSLVDPRVCRLIPGSGVNLELFTPSFPKRNAQRTTFLMFGRLLPQKGYRTYLAAAEVLKEKFGNRADFWILGIEDKNREESKALLKDIRAAHERGIVRYIPQAVDVTPILKDVDVAVLPSSYNEGIPRSLLEAMASGKAIVTSNWKGCRDTVEDGVNGFLVPVGDQSAVEDALSKMIIMEPEVLRGMGFQSRTLVERKYDEQLVINAYLKEILGEEVPLSAKVVARRRVGESQDSGEVPVSELRSNASRA